MNGTWAGVARSEPVEVPTLYFVDRRSESHEARTLHCAAVYKTAVLLLGGKHGKNVSAPASGLSSKRSQLGMFQHFLRCVRQENWLLLL